MSCGGAGGGSIGLGKGGGFFFAASRRLERLSRWNGSVGVSSSVSAPRTESVEMRCSWESRMLSCSCSSLSGVNISSTSVWKIFPLNTSTTFAVTSFSFHLGGVFSAGLGVLRSARPRRFPFAGFFLFAMDVDRTACTDDLGFFLKIPRVKDVLRATGGVSSSYQPRVAAFASASAFPTAWKAASVSRINCSTLSEKSSISGSFACAKLRVGFSTSPGTSSARAPMRSKVEPAAIVAVDCSSRLDFEMLDADDRGGDCENMRRHVCASMEALLGDNGGR